MNTLWFVELNGMVIPTPYQKYDQYMEECRRLKETMVAVCVRPVTLNSDGSYS